MWWRDLNSRWLYCDCGFEVCSVCEKGVRQCDCVSANGPGGGDGGSDGNDEDEEDGDADVDEEDENADDDENDEEDNLHEDDEEIYGDGYDTDGIFASVDSSS